MAERPRRRIPEATVARLPVYLRSLLEVAESQATTISSERLAEMAGVNAAKVRKDLSYLGSYGTRGVGYDVAHLLVEIASALNVDRDWPCVIVGAGNLGSALATFAGFTNRGFTVVGVLDVDPAKVGRPLGSLTVRHQDDLAELVAREGVAIGIVAVPPVAAQEAADRLVEVGITSILNFAPTVLDVPDHVQVRDVDLAVELQILAFHEDRSRHGGPDAG